VGLTFNHKTKANEKNLLLLRVAMVLLTLAFSADVYAQCHGEYHFNKRMPAAAC
jgi:hypothetical protein